MKKPVSKSNKSKLKTKSAANPSAAGKVRIIGGQFKRRTVSFIDTEGLRPTPDRLRETLFNWLLADIHGARVLDSCAGSGVLGFEALSRGAAHCTFIEMHGSQAVMLAQSAQQLQLTAAQYQILQGPAEQVLTQDQSLQQPFDLVFIDPPYAAELWQPILTALITKQLLTAESLIYLEADKELTLQLNALAATLSADLDSQGLSHFNAIKQSKVGQVVAGLYQLA
jgi:16S rRNA (guanine966-N2)-methyltransferase